MGLRSRRTSLSGWRSLSRPSRINKLGLRLLASSSQFSIFPLSSEMRPSTSILPMSSKITSTAISTSQHNVYRSLWRYSPVKTSRSASNTLPITWAMLVLPDPLLPERSSGRDDSPVIARRRYARHSSTMASIPARSSMGSMGGLGEHKLHLLTW